MKNQEVISNLLSERKKFILIGLTGRTGSGCTTTANILESEDCDYPDVANVRVDKQLYFKDLDQHRYSIVKNYAVKNHYKFFSIKVSDLITAYLLKLSTTDIVEFVDSYAKPDIKARLSSYLESKRQLITKVKNKTNTEITRKFLDHTHKNKLTTAERGNFYLYMGLIRRFTEKFKHELNNCDENLYLKVYQAAGNSIRKLARVKSGFEGDDFEPSSVLHLPETINRIIKEIRRTQGDSPCHVVIDAIRNPYEAKYFKDRYSAFYLVSINAPNEDRKRYLQNVHKYTVAQFDELEKRESGLTEITDSEFISQNVQRCIEISDIHIFNPRKEAKNHNVLKAQLAWYIALMQHPGLVTPTSLERVMQFAYTAKINSGCISRQVGAVVTDEDFSIKAVGWNDVPAGQVPCNLRSLNGVINHFDPVVYSEYERKNEKFRGIAIKELKQLEPLENTGRNLAYCFKSLKYKVDGDKNQVHTRSLHAEENAFLQLAKYGGPGISGGKLFTTASPCELCSKKAYQLGIDEIVFIDPYPGIATEHIISIGNKQPKLVQFRGAVGKGYHQLYEPLMPYKDELAYLKS